MFSENPKSFLGGIFSTLLLLCAEPFPTFSEMEYPHPFCFSGSMHLQSLFLLDGVRGEVVEVDPPLKEKKRDKGSFSYSDPRNSVGPL